MFEVMTKAYSYDNALAFGKAGYLGTVSAWLLYGSDDFIFHFQGRGFQLTHISFTEIYRNTSISHLYLGLEAIMLITLVTTYGNLI